MHDSPHGSALYCELAAPGDTTAKTYERHGWQIREGHTGHAHHHTITAGEVSLLDAAACRRLIDATAALLADYLSTARRILVVGLGNAALTADRLGPAVCGKLTLAGQAPVGRTLYSFVPGVPAVTGIPTDRLVTLAAHAIQAERILAVDALCARSAAMLGQVVQLSDGGLVPGSGVQSDAGEASPEIADHTMPCPVVTAGVPTVIRTTLPAGGQTRYLVTTGDTDRMVERWSSILASAIMKAAMLGAGGK